MKKPQAKQRNILKPVLLTAVIISIIWLLILTIHVSTFYTLYNGQEKMNSQSIYQNIVDTAQLKECYDLNIKPCTTEAIQKAANSI